MSKIGIDIAHESANTVRITLSGQIDADRLHRARDALAIAMQDKRHGDVIIIDEWARWHVNLLPGGPGSRLWAQMMAMLHHLDRCALVSDNQLLRSVTALEGALVAHHVVRSFNAEVTARNWLARAALAA